MAHAQSSSAANMIIDDDIQRVAENILRKESDEGEKLINLDTENHRRVLEAICMSLQAERNGWKERLQHTLQEIDRQHKASIVLERTLQELVTNLGIVKLDEPPESGRKSSDIIHCLQTYIENLQDKVDSMADTKSLRTTLVQLQDTAKQLETEKQTQGRQLKEKQREVLWLQKELNTVKYQLQKLQKIVLNYNQSHSTKLHLEQEEEEECSVEDARRRTKSGGRPPGLISRERTYVEGDQLNYFTTTGEEIAVWKLRHQKKGCSSVSGGGSGSNHRGGGGGTVTQCLRCNQLFKSSDNNNKACRFHKKGRQIREQYDPSGRLLRVLYTWACCKKGLDAPGCSTGHHI